MATNLAEKAAWKSSNASISTARETAASQKTGEVNESSKLLTAEHELENIQGAATIFKRREQSRPIGCLQSY
jgi:hypothetical protein